MHMHVCMCAIFDPSEMPGGYSFDKVQRLIAAKVHTLAPFRRRLVEVPFGLHHPVWIEDPDFDIIHHVRHVALPAPGGEEEFGAMVGRIYSTPLDRSRPLWEAWVIEGLEGGRFALFMKFHHSAVDGVSGAQLVMELLHGSLTSATRPFGPVVPRRGRVPAASFNRRLSPPCSPHWYHSLGTSPRARAPRERSSAAASSPASRR